MMRPSVSAELPDDTTALEDADEDDDESLEPGTVSAFEEGPAVAVVGPLDVVDRFWIERTTRAAVSAIIQTEYKYIRLILK